jgi:hypothetical protein
LEAEIWDLHSNDSEEDDLYEEYKKASKRFEKIVEEDRKGYEKLKIERMTEAKKTRESGHFFKYIEAMSSRVNNLAMKVKGEQKLKVDERCERREEKEGIIRVT